MFSLQPSWMWCCVVLLFSVCILTTGLSALLSPTQVITGHFCICKTSLFLTYLYLCSSYFCFFSNKAHALSQNKGRMFLWNVGTPCCTTVHHMCRNYFSTNCCEDLKSHKAESCGRNSQRCLFTYIFEFIQLPPSVCTAKHFNVKVFSEAYNKDTSMQQSFISISRVSTCHMMSCVVQNIPAMEFRAPLLDLCCGLSSSPNSKLSGVTSWPAFSVENSRMPWPDFSLHK